MLITVPYGGAGVDMYLASLPAMTKAMDASKFEVQLTVLVYLLVYGFGQIFFGPVVDRWGRRWPTAIGAAVAARCIVADCYEGAARVRAANWMTVAWACGPILSPALGANLQVWFGWQATFWVLFGWALLSVFTSLILLPETRRVFSTASFAAIFRPYGQIITDRIYVPAAITMGGLITLLYVFEVLAPFYVQVKFNESTTFYGYLQLCMGALWLSGNLASRFLENFSTDYRRVTVAAVIIILVSIGMIAANAMGAFSLWQLAIPSGVCLFFAASIWPLLYAVCLGRFPHAGGMANGLVSGMFCIISFFFTISGTLLESRTALPLWIIYLIAMAVVIFILTAFLREVFHRGVRHIEAAA